MSDVRAKMSSLLSLACFSTFGRTISQSGPLANVFRFRHATKCYDWETGIYYYGKRYYLPRLRRWLNRDPLEERGGLNLYAFCRNNPLVYVDKDGQAYFAVRRLNYVPAIIKWSSFLSCPFPMVPMYTEPSSVKDVVDKSANERNVEILHEHLFYGDGTNAGYGSAGVMHDENVGQYERRDMREYDDCVMKEAESRVVPPKYSLIGLFGDKYNCQDYADDLRRMYDAIKDMEEIKCKCGKK